MAALVLVSGCKAEKTLGEPSPSHSSHDSKASKGDEATARKDLKGLKLAAPDSMTGYSRRQFGTAWKDVDRNGCDTRNDILARDLKDIGKRGKCVVISGKLHDPYTGDDITFAKAQATKVQIDHIFPLGLAWQMGADHWTEDKRTKLANDRENLLAVSGRPNEQKSDKGPSEWKPRKAYECTYAEKFINVADDYELHVARADKAALQDMLGTC